MNFSIVTAVIPYMHLSLSEVARSNLAVEIEGTKYELNAGDTFGL